MNSKVTPENPYSRLMALQTMGIVKNYEQIRQVKLSIIGLGGVGSVAAEMLTRCGVGRLLLCDYDKVELSNMNRLFYRPDQSGMYKVEAAKQSLEQINPDVQIETFNQDITTSDWQKFKELIQQSSDLLLCCVDNYAARVTINRLCAELNLTWIESGVSENALQGHIQFIFPGETACFECAPALAILENNEKQIQRPGVCAASLPTTMGIIAGFLVQATLKFILKFGETKLYLGYSAFNDFFTNIPLLPNPHCVNQQCKDLQAYYSQNPQLKRTNNLNEVKQEQTIEIQNDWNIEVEDIGDQESKPQQQDASIKEIVEGKNIQDLAAQLKNLQS